MLTRYDDTLIEQKCILLTNILSQFVDIKIKIMPY